MSLSDNLALPRGISPYSGIMAYLFSFKVGSLCLLLLFCQLYEYRKPWEGLVSDSHISLYYLHKGPNSQTKE